MTLHLGGALLRVIPLHTVIAGNPAVFHGSYRGRAWCVTPEQLAGLQKWALRGSKKTARSAAEPTPRPPASKVVRTAQAPTQGYFRRRAKSHPLAARGLLDDCDYAHKLNPAEKAFLDQFMEETVLNRWRDREGITPLYPRGSEARRKLQFEFNRRYDDISNHKEWWPASVEEDLRSIKNRADGMRIRRTLTMNMLPAASPNEDDLINAIDRSRE